MKLCVDCIHHRRAAMGVVVQHVCYALGRVDPVTGQQQPDDCYAMRRALVWSSVDVTDCGPEAKLFKPKGASKP